MNGVMLWFVLLLMALFVWEQLPVHWRQGLGARPAAPALGVALLAGSLFVTCTVLA